MYKKKSLGQHFLKSAAYLRAVADAADVTEGELIVEIGPGDGALTKELLSRGAHVIALEKDRRLIPLLEATFSNELYEKKFSLLEIDALDADIKKIVGNKGFKVVANIPYYITGALLKKFLSEKTQPTTLVFLIQKEVAERIARSKKESILSLSIKAYGIPKYIKTVPSGAFSPAPNVDSAILLISNISKNNFENAKHEDLFFEIVRAGFSQKRKLLKNNLEQIFKERVLERMRASKIPENARAEDVPLEKWLALTR